MHRTTLLVVATIAAMTVAPAPGPSAQAAAPPSCDGHRATIVGTPGDDTLTGTSRRDVIVGLAGRDRIDGLGGDDVLCGGDNYDRIHGGGGDDRVLGQGDDCHRQDDPSPCRLQYGDSLSGGAGDDAIIGGGRRDRRAPDTVNFRDATRGVVVDLAAGTSTGQGTDTLVGIGAAVTTPYDDVVSGVRGGRTLGGDDVVETIFVVARGWLNTGAGDDTIRFAAGGHVVAGPGDDVVEVVGDGEDTDPRSRRTEVRTGDGDDVVEGSDFRENVSIDHGNDEIRLGGGNDIVDDGRGASVVDGGEGADRIRAGRGDDTYDGGEGPDRIDYGWIAGGRGLIIDLAAGTATGLGGDDSLAGFEKVSGSGYSDVISGDDGPNVLVSRGGDDVLHGRGGDDHLVTRALGSSELYGDAGDDILELDVYEGKVNGLGFDGGEGRDLFWISNSIGIYHPVTIDLSSSLISGFGRAALVAVEDVKDNAGDHVLIGDDGPNVLTGGPGADRLEGRGGDDTLIGGGGGRDTGDGGDGVDACDVESPTACEP